jgi:hypothetical protein
MISFYRKNFRELFRMKPRILPIIMTLLGGAGLVLFMVLPIMTHQVTVVDTFWDHDVTISFNVYYNGSGTILWQGTVGGSPEDTYYKVEQDTWDSELNMSEEFPDITLYLCTIGLGVAILGMLFSVFGGNTGFRIIGAILGLAGAGMVIAGCFLMWNFNADFQQQCLDYAHPIIQALLLTLEEPVTGYSTFGIGWLGAVSSMGLIALSSFVLMFIKPRRKY